MLRSYNQLLIPTELLKADLLKWLEEDISSWDISSQMLQNKVSKAIIFAKQSGMIVGVEIAELAFELLDCTVDFSIKDGDLVEKGDTVLKVHGNIANLLQVERLVLNLLCHLSGIATQTHEYVKQVTSLNQSCRIAATRKTLPGLRKYQKYAVQIAGGDTHRLNLSTMVMLKENHIAGFSSITEALQVTKASISFSNKIEIEVTNDKEAIEAAESGIPDIIMLDNFSPKQILSLLNKIKTINPSVLLEASGNISSENILEYISSGVDIISMGSLTHSVKNFDLSMLIEE